MSVQKRETSEQSESEESRNQKMAKMQWSLFLLILMGSFLTCQQYEYHFIEEKKTWYDARKYCRENYTDLATVYDMTDVTRLCKSKENQQEAWIGLHNMPGIENTKWHWSLPGVEYDATETKLCHGQLRVERCFRILDCIIRLYWSPTPCTEKHGFICYDGKKPHKKFHVIQISMTWQKAQSHCREKHTDLVSGLNQLEDKELIREIQQYPFRRYWVGDTWMWSDQSPSSFRHWDHNYFVIKPDKEKCAVTMMDETGRWKTDDCGEEKSFFCYDDKVILIRENKTWEEALYYCREKYRDLVSITNLHQQNWVKERAKIADSPFVWLGLRYTCTLDFWFWVSDEVVSYKNWDSDGQKDECDMSGAMKREGHKWFSRHDNEKNI
ncbi:macrophage mannose receptor 1-like isoform X3 [Thunnus maccoyii]|uniref:macrophage mannose receptor 1-like isoform X2 n=1 Tax=Thunnus maccoyii TaxID=8240 RepID=UPI001C4BB6B3|nr:macrophage mannose receptor 1-like isoform X2 [Thunnus maccoyii]XP_042257162.1 macrophage mannose receptor 1-like isoform X3 [Thunnus maccoyii]